MKKAKLLSLFAILVCMAVAMIAAKGVEAEGPVATSSVEAWKFAGGWEVASSYVDSGVKAVIPGASNPKVPAGEQWKYSLRINNEASVSKSFSLKNNEVISFEFSALGYDADGKVISKSVNSDAIDIYMFDASNNAQLALLRIFTDAGVPLNGDHPYELYGTDWNKTVGGNWIKGAATADSSFYIQFDKTNLFSSYVGGAEEVKRLDDADNNYLAKRQSAFENVDEVYFVIQGENGFTADMEIIIKAINGQSLANVDGNFTDSVAPKFLDSVVSSTLSVGAAYTIPTEAFDLFGIVNYSLDIDGTIIEGKTFTPSEAGDLVVKLVATDAAGNFATKEIVFNVVSAIPAPTIVALPDYSDMTVDYFDMLTFSIPEYTDETGAATAVLNIYQNDELLVTLNETEAHNFKYEVASSFVSGEYKLVYEISNSSGTTASEPIVVNINLAESQKAEFVTVNGTVADYVENGVRVRSNVCWRASSFGIFDIAHGLDVKYIVPQNASNGRVNPDGACLELVLTNVDDPNYKLMYRVWTKYNGADAPTNVYISYNGGLSFTDITDTGWISRTVDEVENQYHMLIDLEETFQGERTGGIMRVEKAYDQLVAFLAAAPSTVYELAFDCSILNAQAYTEYIVTEINGQSLALNASKNDVFLHVDNMAETVEINQEVLVKAYAKDIFEATSINLSVTKPDGSSETVVLENGQLNYLFEALGEYTFVISSVGANGKTVSKEVKVMCKSTTADIELVVPSYEANYALNTEITILDATYSDNVVTKVITISKPDGSKVEVAVNDKFKFVKPGIYTITYYAADNAEPVANEKSEVITINIPDTSKPVVEVVISDKAAVGDRLTPSITVTDDSEYDITVSIEKPNKSVENLSKANNYEVSFTEEGTYTLKVVVEDIYGNKETVTKTISVSSKAEKKGCGGSLSASILGLTTLAGAIFVISKRKKEE